jgi:hypothetical protein
MLTIASNQPPNEPLTYCTSNLGAVETKLGDAGDSSHCAFLALSNFRKIYRLKAYATLAAAAEFAHTDIRF